MPFNLGGPELIIILVIVLIVFGAGKLPNVMRDVGKGVKEFKKAQDPEEVGTPVTTVQTTAAPPPVSVSSDARNGTNGTTTITPGRPSEPAPRA